MSVSSICGSQELSVVLLPYHMCATSLMRSSMQSFVCTKIQPGHVFHLLAFLFGSPSTGGRRISGSILRPSSVATRHVQWKAMRISVATKKKKRSPQPFQLTPAILSLYCESMHLCQKPNGSIWIIGL